MTPDPARGPDHDGAQVPAAYRQGLITAITVFLGFSLVFLRFWSFEAPGDWTASSLAAAALMAAATVLQIVALWRSLQIEDDELAVYKVTLRWFLASILVLSVSLLLAAVISGHDAAPGVGATPGSAGR